MGRLLTRFFSRYARWSSEHPLLPLLGIALLIGLSLVSVRRIGLDASFEALLPEGTPSVEAREEARRRVGSTDLFLIAIRGPDPPSNHRFAEALASRIEQWPETEWATASIDLDVFRDSALLFMDLEDLRELVDLVELRVLRGQCEFRGNCNETDLRTDEEREADDRRLRELAERYQRRIGETAGDRGELARRHPELRDALMNEEGTVAVVIARLSGTTSDLDFARRILLRGERLIHDLDPPSFHPELEAAVSGAYRSSNEYETVRRDATTASLISLGLVVVVVLIFMRRFSAVVLVALSLVVGVVWTLGFTGVTYPTLNTITAVIFGILLGMGIDFSIHYCVAARAERGRERTLSEALEAAGPRCIPAMVTSALTTAAALLTLAAAHNRGFREFGLIGAGGVLLCLLAALLVIPPLWGLLDRIREDRRRLPVPRDDWMARNGPAIALAVGLGLCALLAWRAPLLPFEYNLSNLSAPSTAHRIPYGEALRTARSSSPGVLLGDSEEQLRQAHRLLMARKEAGDERILDVITIETFLPTDQEAKLEEIDRLRSLLRPRTLRRVAEAYREELTDLARMAQVEEPLELEDLPDWARRSITERSGDVGEIGYLHNTLPGGDARLARRFQEDYGQIETEAGDRPVRVATARFVIADVVYTMMADGKLMALLAIAAVILLLLIDLRSLAGALACALVLALGLVWGLGMADWLGWKLGVFNMLVIPVALGLGIDGAVHLFHRYRRGPKEFLERPLGATGLAVLASSVTTLAGFSGLLFVRHRGLETIGQLAILTVGFTLIAVLGVLPGVLIKLARRRAERGSGEG